MAAAAAGKRRKPEGSTCIAPILHLPSSATRAISTPSHCNTCATAAADILGQRLHSVSKQLVADVLPLTTHTRFRVRVVALQTLTPLMHLVGPPGRWVLQTSILCLGTAGCLSHHPCLTPCTQCNSPTHLRMVCMDVLLS
jgi:hypothetical protein